jgi:RND superfamily putative drug exporter
MFESWTRWVLRHRVVVVVVWVSLTVGGMAAASSLGHALSQSFSIPGSGVKATTQIVREFGSGGRIAPLVGVVSAPGKNLAEPLYAHQAQAAFARLAAAEPGSRFASYETTGDTAFLSADRHTEFALVFPRPGQSGNLSASALAAARRAVSDSRVAGAPVHITGLDALNAAGTKSGGPGVLVEALLGAGGALAVLAFVFASFIAIVPLLTAAAAIMTTLLVVRGLAATFSVSMIVEYLIGLIGLGVAIDYALLVIVRWREERAKGADTEEAVIRAMRTAGRAVMFSGITVGVGLCALVVLPVPFLRSVGVAGMLIPLISVAVALTLLPVILATIGPRLDWPRLRHEEQASRGWLAWGRLTVRHRLLAAGLGTAVLAALLLAATTIHFGEPAANAMASQGDAHAALVQLEQAGIGAGALSPIETIAPASQADKTAARFDALRGVRTAVAPVGNGWRESGQAIVDVLPQPDAATSAGAATLKAVKRAAGSEVQVGGLQASAADFVSAVYGSFPLMIALVALLTFVLLARAFRSLLLPLKAVLLNVLSVGAAWGVMTLVWQDGHGSHLIWGIPATGVITQWVPLMMFAFLFGLSMDYEVFILARMREEYDATGSTNEAAVHGIARTGRLVTSAALILFLSFVAMATGPETDLKILATGLGAGILLDATVVRALLVPSLVSLFGRWNWWLPHWPARLLRVEPSAHGGELLPAERSFR